MTEGEIQGEDCPRCGSLLPDEEEGLCTTCGYEFGRATLYMPVIRREEEKPRPQATPAAPGQGHGGPDVSPQVPAVTPDPARPRRKIILVLAALFTLLFFLLLFTVAVFWTVQKVSAVAPEQTGTAVVAHDDLFGGLGSLEHSERSWAVR